MCSSCTLILSTSDSMDNLANVLELFSFLKAQLIACIIKLMCLNYTLSLSTGDHMYNQANELEVYTHAKYR